MDIYNAEFQREFFNSFARRYYFINILSLGFVSRIRRRAVKCITFPENAIVCDLMSGNGSNVPFILKKGNCGKIYVVDFSEVMLKEAEKKHPGKNFYFLNENSLQLSLENESVDVVTCTFGIKTLCPEDRLRLLDEIKRILKPGGKFVLAEVSKPKQKFPLAISFFFFNYILEIEALLFNYKFIRRRFLWRYVAAFGSSKTIEEYASTQFEKVNFFSWYGGMITGISGEK